VELRPFRCLRHSPRVVLERGLSALIGVPADGSSKADAPESLRPLLFPAGGPPPDPEAAARTFAQWIAAGILLRERRPALWIYRRTGPGEIEIPDPPLLVGLVRLGARGTPAPAEGKGDPVRAAEKLALRRATKVDFETSLLTVRAPLNGALATTRRPDISAVDAAGGRHDAWRVQDFAQHVELQGLVKNADAEIAAGEDPWEAARQFDGDPDAARLPGARFKLAAIAEESARREESGGALPHVPAGLFGVSLEDPVY